MLVLLSLKCSPPQPVVRLFAPVFGCLAQFRDVYSLEQIASSPVVHEPLTKLQVPLHLHAMLHTNALCSVRSAVPVSARVGVYSCVLLCVPDHASLRQLLPCFSALDHSAARRLTALRAPSSRPRTSSFATVCRARYGQVHRTSSCCRTVQCSLVYSALPQSSPLCSSLLCRTLL